MSVLLDFTIQIMTLHKISHCSVLSVFFLKYFFVEIPFTIHQKKEVQINLISSTFIRILNQLNGKINNKLGIKIKYEI